MEDHQARVPGFSTILSGATESMLVAHEETFGPLAPIFSFNTELDVIKWAYDTEFGLAGYFFSNNDSRVMQVAQKLWSQPKFEHLHNYVLNLLLLLLFYQGR